MKTPYVTLPFAALVCAMSVQAQTPVRTNPVPPFTAVPGQTNRMVGTNYAGRTNFYPIGTNYPGGTNQGVGTNSPDWVRGPGATNMPVARPVYGRGLAPTNANPRPPGVGGEPVKPFPPENPPRLPGPPPRQPVPPLQPAPPVKPFPPENPPRLPGPPPRQPSPPVQPPSTPAPPRA